MLNRRSRWVAPALVLVMAIASGCQNASSTAPETTESESVVSTTTSQEVPQEAETASATDEASSPSGAIAPESSNAAEPASTNLPSGSALSPGRHCFALETDILTEAIRLNVDKTAQVVGDRVGTVHNDAAGYYTSYRSQLRGQLQGNQLPLGVKTWIEYDVQEETQRWSLMSGDRLKTGHETLTAVDCATVADRFANDQGLEAADLTDSANQVRRQRISFAPGTTSATVENAVVRGDRDVYLVGAQGGQTLNLRITSLEDNAVFDVVDPSGLILVTEASNEQILLPHTGDYEVIVGGTRGNASYSLTVEIP